MVKAKAFIKLKENGYLFQYTHRKQWDLFSTDVEKYEFPKEAMQRCLYEDLGVRMMNYDIHAEQRLMFNDHHVFHVDLYTPLNELKSEHQMDFISLEDYLKLENGVGKVKAYILHGDLGK